MPFEIKKIPPMVQVRRTAQAIGCEPILEEVISNKGDLVEAAERGIPPVGAVSAKLKAKFPDKMKLAPVRQFVGTAVKALLRDEGFEVHQTGVRLPRDSVFSTGAVYRKAKVVADKGREAVRNAFANMVKGLTLTEKRLLMDVLETALGER